MDKETFIKEKLKDLKAIQNQNKPNSTIYINSNNTFILEKDMNKVYCSYYEIWNILETKCSMTYLEVQNYLKPILENVFNTKNIIPLCRYSANQNNFILQKTEI
jgi:hypothetical protein